MSCGNFVIYLVTLDLCDVAVRFREAVRLTVLSLREHPAKGTRFRIRNPQLQTLRSWPVTGFEAIRIYYLPDYNIVRIVRILHGKRNVRIVLEWETVN